MTLHILLERTRFKSYLFVSKKKKNFSFHFLFFLPTNVLFYDFIHKLSWFLSHQLTTFLLIQTFGLYSFLSFLVLSTLKLCFTCDTLVLYMYIYRLDMGLHIWPKLVCLFITFMVEKKM